MNRVADYSIKGYLYQFHKTLHEILNAPSDADVVVEGPIEDIDIIYPNSITTIQCKYHETHKTFTLSSIYEPVLQIMKHFHEHPLQSISYQLYAYFPNEPPSLRHLTETEVAAIFATKDKSLMSLAESLRDLLDVPTFLTRFSLIFGPSYDQLVDDVLRSLSKNGIPETDLKGLAYPNAINFITERSIQHSPTDRTITKSWLLNRLNTIKTTLLTRWTLALKTKKQILTSRKKQLSAHLRLNQRTRHFLIKHAILDDFDEGIVKFIKDYLTKYYHKTSHDSPPTFCLDCNAETFDEIRLRIHKQGIRFADGYIGSYFDESFLLRQPLHVYKGRALDKREFLIRLVRFSPECKLLNKSHCDDFIIIADQNRCDVDLKDVNAELLFVNNLSELSYLLGVKDSYE